MKRGVEWMKGLGVGFSNPVGTGEMLDVCLCCGGVCRVWVGVGAWNRIWRSGWCYICVSCESGLFV